MLVIVIVTEGHEWISLERTKHGLNPKGIRKWSIEVAAKAKDSVFDLFEGFEWETGQNAVRKRGHGVARYDQLSQVWRYLWYSVFKLICLLILLGA